MLSVFGLFLFFVFVTLAHGIVHRVMKATSIKLQLIYRRRRHDASRRVILICAERPQLFDYMTDVTYIKLQLIYRTPCDDATALGFESHR